MMNECPEPQKNISLMDFIFYCLEKWRWVGICMLLFAIAAGGYKYQETLKGNKLVQNNEVIEEDVKESESYQSTQYYERAIEELEKDLDTQEGYLKNSVVMQLDPYHISTGTLSYFVEGSEHIGNVIAAYSSFVSSGRLAEGLYSVNNKIPVEDLRFLVSFINSTSEVYNIDNSANTIYKIEEEQVIKFAGTGSAVFQIQIRMPENVHDESYMEHAKEIMEEYTSQLQTEVAEHRLTLLSSVQSEMMDSDIQEYQSTVRTAYTTSLRGLQTLKAEFKTFQETKDVQNNVSTTVPTLKNPVSSAIRFAIFGLVLGGILACFILLVLYMLGGKLQDIEEFKNEFGMPLLGLVRVSGNKRKLFGFMDTCFFRLRGGAFAKISYEEQVKMAAANVQTSITGSIQKSGVKKIMLSGTIVEKDVSALCNHLSSELTDVSLSSYKQIVFQSSALKELEDYDGILFLEKRGVSESATILQEKKLALDRNVKVLGTVVVC